MKNIMCLIFICLSLGACGLPGLPAGAPIHAPYVVSVTPQAGTTLSKWPVIELTFSEPILESSVTPLSLFIMNRADYADYDETDWVTLYKDVKNQRVNVIDGSVDFSEGDTRVLFYPEEVAANKGDYVVVALPAITTPEHEPLDQMRAGDLVRQFQASFVLSKTASGDDAAPIISASGNGATDSGASESAGATGGIPAIESSHDATGAANSGSVAGSAMTDSANMGSAEAGSDAAEVLPEIPPFDFERVLITEIVTDPQQDHGESTPGNAIKFDSIAGKGSIGSTDEYIEIYNGTPASVDLSSWSVNMIDGSDVTEAVSDAAWTKFFSAGGTVDHFLAGEVLVLGNPNGDMKNTLQVELTDQAGEVRQSIFVEDANATSPADESFSLDEAGDYLMTPATPGEFDL